MARDRYERKHRRTWRHPECIRMVSEAKPDDTMSLAAAMGNLWCIHGNRFPCAQCKGNRQWNEAATGKKLTDAEFEARYAVQPD